MKNLTMQRLVRVALLMALTIVLQNYLGIRTMHFKIGFAFVPIAICAMLYGPLWAGGMAAAADLLAWVLYPVGPYFPGFTLTAFLTGIIFGLFLRRNEAKWKSIILAVVLTQLVCGMLVNTYWLTILYDTPFTVMFVTRIPQFAVLVPLQIVVIRLINSKKFLTMIDNPRRRN